MYCDAYARLQDSVALGDNSQFGINDSLVQRVCDGTDELRGSATRKLCVGIKR